MTTEHYSKIKQMMNANWEIQQQITDVNDNKIQRSNQQPTGSHHAIISSNRYDDTYTNMSTSGHINFTKVIVEPVNDEVT